MTISFVLDLCKFRLNFEREFSEKSTRFDSLNKSGIHILTLSDEKSINYEDKEQSNRNSLVTRNRQCPRLDVRGAELRELTD